MIVRAAFLAMLLATVADARPSPPMAPARTLVPRDAFALASVTDPQISPDGKRVAYVRVSEDILTDAARREVWLVDIASGRQQPLGTIGASQPRWSPDGTRLAFVAKGAGDKPQLFVRWLAGEAAAITALPESPADIAWSPDGGRIAFTMFVPSDGAMLGAALAKPEGAKWADPIKVIDRINYRADGEGYARAGYNHIFVVSAEGGAPRQLTFGDYDDGGGVAWMPDGRRLIFSANRSEDWERHPLDTDVFTVDVADATLTRLTTRDGPDESPAPSPDGRLIAFVGADDRGKAYQDPQLSVMNADGSGVRLLTAALDRPVADPRWTADGKAIDVSYVDRGVTKVARVTLDGRATEIARGLAGAELDRPYSGGGFSIAKDATIAFTAGDASHPADLAVAGRGGQIRRLTALNADLFAGKTLAAVRPLAVTSSAGGMPIDAWMMTPPGYDPATRYPLILEIHGGPYASYGPVWATEDQLYAQAGYVVVYANPRGSTSYGQAFADQIDKAYPGQDYDDLMSVVDAAIATGSVDPNQLFVTGGSGGGLLTAWIVGRTRRFRAAVSQKPVVNWTSETLTTDGFAEMARSWFGKMPWEDPEAFWRRSPLSLIGNVATPTAVMVGEDDHRTPPSEAEQLYAALQLHGVSTMLIRVPGASHGGLAERPSQLIGEADAILAWFGRYRTTK